MLQSYKKVLLVILTAALAMACGEEKNENNYAEERVRQVPVETIIIELDQFNDFIRLTGIVEALEDAVISAETSGRILSIVDRGEYVERGSMIAQLDDRLTRAQFSAAKTNFELAEDTFNRLEALYADSIISTQDFNNARAQRDQAKAQLEQAEKQLQDVHISAPFDGRVEERMIRSGELINPGQPVARLVNTNRVRIMTGIPERYSGDISEGSEVRIRFISLGDEIRESSVAYAGNVIDPDTRTFTVEVELSNPERRIKPDMVADLQVQRETLTGVVIIPRTAIIRDEEGTSVFVAREENGRKVTDLVSVTTGPASGAIIQITDGLNEGDEVVVNGMRNLSVGDHLNILKTEGSLERAKRIQSEQRSVATY